MTLTDIQTRGYVVVPNFITAQDIDRLLLDYQNSLAQATSQGFENKNYRILSSYTPHLLNDRITTLLTQVRHQTDLQVDFCDSIGNYFDNALVKFDWHQDHETYYLWQNSYHTLNYWIPLIKPNPQESGVKVIPFDRLGSAQSLIQSRGASRFTQVCNKFTQMHDDDQGQVYTLKFNIDDLAETPTLGVGDLLLMRGDTIHCTQTATTPRVSLSIRCTNTQGWIDRDRFFTRCEVKENMIKNNPKLYYRLSTAFAKKSQVQIVEVVL